MSIITTLTFVADPSRAAQSYAQFNLINSKPDDEQIVIFHTDDQRHAYPLTFAVNQTTKVISIAALQPGCPLHGSKYDQAVDNVVAYRSTLIDNNYVTFVDGARLTAATLNLATEQIMHLLQETQNRLDTTVHWELLPEFECLLLDDIQCDVTQNLADIVTLFSDVGVLYADVGTRFNYTPMSTIYDSEGAATTNVVDLYDHTAAQYQFIDQLRADVSWLLCQSPAYDGDSIETVTTVAPVNSEGTTWTSGCQYVKLIFTFESNKVEEIVYIQPPHITSITSTDLGNYFRINLNYCDGTTTNSTDIAKLVGPTGPQGEIGETGDFGKGYWIWGQGSLSELASITQPNMNTIEYNQQDSVCYFITHDETPATNPLKGVAGGIFQNLTPTFKDPQDSITGLGDYTGYLLRFERLEDGTYEWFPTGTMHPLGLSASPAPLRWHFELGAANNIHQNNHDGCCPAPGYFRHNYGGASSFAAVTMLRLNHIDASGADVGDLLWALTQPHNRPQNRGVCIMHSERNPSWSASFVITSATQSNEGGNGDYVELQVTNLHVYPMNFPFFDPGVLNTPDRIYIDIHRAGDNYFDELNDLTDVTIASPLPGEVLQYNNSTSKWENDTLTSPYEELEFNLVLEEFSAIGLKQHLNRGHSRDYIQSVVNIPDHWTHFAIKYLQVQFDTLWDHELNVSFGNAYPRIEVWYANAVQCRVSPFETWGSSALFDGWRITPPNWSVNSEPSWDMPGVEKVYQLDIYDVNTNNNDTVKVISSTGLAQTTGDSNILNVPDNGSITNVAEYPDDLYPLKPAPIDIVGESTTSNGSIFIHIPTHIVNTDGTSIPTNWDALPESCHVNLVLYGDTL